MEKDKKVEYAMTRLSEIRDDIDEIGECLGELDFSEDEIDYIDMVIPQLTRAYQSIDGAIPNLYNVIELRKRKEKGII